MPKRFEAYRMRDGQTPLSEDFFNGVFGDIDTRIADLEARRADLQGVVDELTKFGLARIDTLVGPSMAEVNAMLVQLRQRRDELEAAIGNVGDLATQTQMDSAIGDAMDAEAQARNEAITVAVQAEATARAAEVTAEAAARAAAIALATARPSAPTVTYDGNGRVSGITETLPQGVRATVLTYNAAGRVNTVAETLAGKTRTTTYAYDGAGRVSGYAVVEV
jgi:YD repeat-containing protein